MTVGMVGIAISFGSACCWGGLRGTSGIVDDALMRTTELLLISRACT
jgi:hypothetical protein